MLNENSDLKIEYHGSPEQFSSLNMHQIKMDAASRFGIPYNSISIEKKHNVSKKADAKVSVGEQIRNESFSKEKQRQIYQDYIRDNQIDVNIDDFFKMERYISSQTVISEKTRNRFSILRVDAHNILSYREFHKTFDETFGLIQSLPQNGAGKSNFMNMCKIGLWGEYKYPDLETKTKLNEIFNDLTRDSSAHINTLIEVNGIRYFINRVFNRKSSVSQSLNFIQICEKEKADVFFDTDRNELLEVAYYNKMRTGHWGINLNKTKNTQSEINALIGTISDFYYSAILSSDNLNKWLTTKPTERYNLFYEYFGLEVFMEKQTIAKKEYNEFKKKSKLNSLSPEKIEEEIEKAETDNRALEGSIRVFEENLLVEKKSLESLEAEIAQGYSGLYSLPDYFSSFDVQLETQKLESQKLELSQMVSSVGTKKQVLPKEPLNQRASELDAILMGIDVSGFDARLFEITDYVYSEEELLLLDSLKEQKQSLTHEYLSKKAALDVLKKSLDEVPDDVKCENCDKVLYSGEVKRNEISKEIERSQVELDGIVEQGKTAKAALVGAEQSIEAKKAAKKTENELLRQSILQEKAQYVESIREKVLLERAAIVASVAQIDAIIKENAEVDAAEAKIASIGDSIGFLEEKIANYNESASKLDLNKTILSQIDGLLGKKKEIQSNISSLQSEINQLSSIKMANDTIIKRNKVFLVDLAEDIKRDKLFKVFIDMHDKDGIPKTILLTYVGVINQTLKEILEVTDFDVEVLFLDSKIEFFFVQNGIKREIYRTSGYQRFASSMAIHYTMMKLTTISVPSIVFMDEIFSSVGSTNMENVKSIIFKFFNIYDSIYVITHNPLMIDWATEENHSFILIVKDDYSRLQVLDADGVEKYKKEIRNISSEVDIDKKQNLEKTLAKHYGHL